MAQQTPPLSLWKDRYIRFTFILGILFGAAGCLAVAPALLIERGWPFTIRSLATPLAYLGAAFLLSASSFAAAFLMALVRGNALERFRAKSAARRARAHKGRTSPSLSWLETLSRKAFDAISTVAFDMAPLAVTIFCGVTALLAVRDGWSLGALPFLAEPSVLQVFGGTLLCLAFPLLVLERSTANMNAAHAPEAPRINRLLRISVFAVVALGLESLLLSVGLKWSLALGMLTAGLCGIIACEILLRCAVTLFQPAPPREARRAVADSTAAGLLRLRLPRPSQLNLAVKNQFGIDLSRSWALSFVQRALLPLAAVMVLVVWLLSGLTSVGTAERAVYERLGVARAVLHSGLHIHLPWPLGIVRRTEFGAVREIPVVLAYEADPGTTYTPPTPPLADGPAPVEDDRLWTAYHASEGIYLIASATGDQQGFQAVSADLTVVYRVGLSDESAIKAVYNVAEPQVLIRSIAGQLLARHFARYSLFEVLVQNREELAANFRTALQEQLDSLDSGIEAIAVIVEAIHPPAGAAFSYHNVQAAEIESRADIARARGNAITSIKSAETQALRLYAEAGAVSEEQMQLARRESTLFAGERGAYEQNRRTFLLERWLEKLSRNLIGTDLLIVDHRLGGANAPTIDLRPTAPAVTQYVPPPSPPSDEDHQ